MRRLVIFAVLWVPALSAKAEAFKWCAATSAHQIEGGNEHSDWWRWEMESDQVQEPSGRAADHWSRWQEDLNWLETLGVNTYRFSVEWAKVEPSAGRFDAQVLQHYRRLVAGLAERGIEPMVTLLHFTLPDWLAQKGGLESQEFPERFRQFAEVVYEHLGPWVVRWITVNEPMVHISAGYVEGVFPPGYQRPIQGIERPLVQMLRGHQKAYHALHSKARRAGRPLEAGMSFHLRAFHPLRAWNVLDQLAASLIGRVWNWTVATALETGRLKAQIVGLIRVNQALPGLAGTQDFFGLNYYSRDLISLDVFGGLQRHVGDGVRTDLDWEIYPEGLYETLKQVHRRFPHLPIYITENGLADGRDQLRPQFLKDHLKVLAQARAEGVRVQGYCHWSLLDNFEWAEGYGPRFGLLEVDYVTFERRPRPSFWLYADWIQQNPQGPLLENMD